MPQGPRITYNCEGTRGDLPMEEGLIGIVVILANITNYYPSGYYYDYALLDCTPHGDF